MRYLQLAGFFTIIIGMLYIRILFSQNQELKEDNLLLVEQISIQKENVETLNVMLERERVNTMTAQKAFIALHKDVTDEEFNTEIPQSIQDLLNEFHNGIHGDGVR